MPRSSSHLVSDEDPITLTGRSRRRQHHDGGEPVETRRATSGARAVLVGLGELGAVLGSVDVRLRVLPQRSLGSRAVGLDGRHGAICGTGGCRSGRGRRCRLRGLLTRQQSALDTGGKHDGRGPLPVSMAEPPAGNSCHGHRVSAVQPVLDASPGRRPPRRTRSRQRPQTHRGPGCRPRGTSHRAQEARQASPGSTSRAGRHPGRTTR